MIYQINKKEDSGLEKTYKEAMDDLNAFYEINWKHHKPRIIIVGDRETINKLKEEETERWTVGWSEGRNVFVLDNEAMEKESSHKKNSVEKYSAFIKHELSHSFFTIKAKGGSMPKWLWEGVAIYTSGQINIKKKPEKFDSFLKYYSEGGEGVYKESGFAVELLMVKFGKQKLLELIESLKDIRSEENFNEKFYEIYGFKPTYEEFNSKIV